MFSKNRIRSTYAAFMAMQLMDITTLNVIVDNVKKNRPKSGIKEKNIYKIIPKGCKEFTFDGITVIALNEKSARKKIDKMLKKSK